MTTRNFRRNRAAAAVAGAVLALGATQAFGTGFQLNENSASSIGNAFAGGAAFTDDVTEMWWNPAALSLFPSIQAAGALHIITPSIKFSNNASLPAVNQPLGGDGGDAGSSNFVPNVYVSVPINPQWAFGLGINVPFGLITEYDDGWLGRYQALKSKIDTINVNPALSWKVFPAIRSRRRRQLPVSQGHVDAKRQLFGRAAHCSCRASVQRSRPDPPTSTPSRRPHPISIRR